MEDIEKKYFTLSIRDEINLITIEDLKKELRTERVFNAILVSLLMISIFGRSLV